MNDFAELEAELKRLRPAPVSAGLWSRIETALAQPAAGPTAGLVPRARRPANFWWSLGLGLAGATALVLLSVGQFRTPRSTGPVPAAAQNTPTRETSRLTSGFRPTGLTQVVYDRRDEGLIFSPNQSEQILRRVRYDTRETMQWRNPTTGASLRVSYPAEQVVLTPVSFQ